MSKNSILYSVFQKINQNLQQFDPKFEIQNDDFSTQILNNWLSNLDTETYQIARQSQTEKPFSGEYCGLLESGDYYCKVCNQHLFDSESKFESKSGWPSYYRSANEFSVKTKSDKAYGMERIEVICSRCGSHLGHVFDDGPKPTGQRFCMNSKVLKFAKSGKKLDLLAEILSKDERENLANTKIENHAEIQNMDSKLEKNTANIVNLNDSINTILNNLNQNIINLESAKKQIENLENSLN